MGYNLENRTPIQFYVPQIAPVA